MIHPLVNLPKLPDRVDLSGARAYLREVAEECAKEVEKSFALPLVSLLQLSDSCFCSSLEEEDKRYGLLVPHLADFAEYRMRVLEQNPWSMVHNGGYPKMDLAWDGWEAAYIVSKRPVSPDRKFWKNIPSKEGKEKSHGSTYTKDFLVTVFASTETENNYNWQPLGNILGKNVDAIKNLIFEFHVKLILMLFNEVELQRMSHHDQLYAECRDFYDDMERLGPIPAAEKRAHKPEAFSYLIESDMFKAATIAVFGRSQEYYIEETVPGCGTEHYHLEEVESLRSKALDLIQQHKPLKGDLKAQLILELTQRKCYHVADTLVLKAINELKLPDLFRECTSGNVVELQELLHSLADSVLESANKLCNMKSMMLANSENDLLKALLCKLGPCKAEVTRVIRIANYERAWQNELVISPAHILISLRLSRVSQCVSEEKLHSRINSLSGASSTFYTFRIYQLACSLAKDLGDGEMGLEHFVFAMVYGCSTENLMEFANQPPGLTLFKRLRESQTECRVQGWRNPDVFMTVLEKRCRGREDLLLKTGRELVVKLAKDIESGRTNLPGDEVLRV